MRKVLSILMNFILQAIAILPMIYFHDESFKDQKDSSKQSVVTSSVAESGLLQRDSTR